MPTIRAHQYRDWSTGGDVAVLPRSGQFVGRMASGGPVSIRVEDGELKGFRCSLKSGGKKGLVIDLATLRSLPCDFKRGLLQAYLSNTAQTGAVVLILKGATDERIVGWILTRENPREQPLMIEFEAVPEGLAWRDQ